MTKNALQHTLHFNDICGALTAKAVEKPNKDFDEDKISAHLTLDAVSSARKANLDATHKLQRLYQENVGILSIPDARQAAINLANHFIDIMEILLIDYGIDTEEFKEKFFRRYELAMDEELTNRAGENASKQLAQNYYKDTEND